MKPPLFSGAIHTSGGPFRQSIGLRLKHMDVDWHDEKNRVIGIRWLVGIDIFLFRWMATAMMTTAYKELSPEEMEAANPPHLEL